MVTDEIVDTISRSSGIEPQKIRTECQNFLKDHPKGEMNRRDFRKFLKIALPKIDVKKMEDNLFRMYDENNDGLIQMEEFLIVYHIFSEGTPEENLTKELCQQIYFCQFLIKLLTKGEPANFFRVLKVLFWFTTSLLATFGFLWAKLKCAKAGTLSGPCPMFSLIGTHKILASGDTTILYWITLYFSYDGCVRLYVDNSLKIFRIFDVDNNDKISKEELKKLIRDMSGVMKRSNNPNLRVTDDDIFNKTWLEMDSDKDGCITREEFISSVLGHKKFSKLLTMQVINLFT